MKTHNVHLKIDSISIEEMAAALTSMSLALLFVTPIWTYFTEMPNGSYGEHLVSEMVQGTKRLPGYSILVSNDTALPPPESSCFTDPGKVTLPTIVEKDCERTARYVWIYQNNSWDWHCPMLEICEVQVFGCLLGEYGENCTKICNHCKNNLSCDTESGRCNSEGCALPGFQMPYCQTCDVGEYGQDCGYNCSGNCLNGQHCDPRDGTCLSCTAGYHGIKCDQESGGMECKVFKCSINQGSQSPSD